MVAAETSRGVVYRLKGSLLEACSCGVLCPCWIGEDPDGGTCYAVAAYHFDSGVVNGVDVSGLTIAGVGIIPGNVLAGGWKMAFFINDEASDEQMNAVLDAYTGKLGGPLADMAKLVGEVVAVERVPMTHEVVEGQGKLRIGTDQLTADMAPYRGADGSITTLRDSIFSTVPGSPAYVSKASTFRVNLPQYNFVWEYEGRNAIQADYEIEYRQP